MTYASLSGLLSWFRHFSSFLSIRLNSSFSGIAKFLTIKRILRTASINTGSFSFELWNSDSVTYMSRFSCSLLAACSTAANAICDGANSKQASVKKVFSRNSSMPFRNRSGLSNVHLVLMSIRKPSTGRYGLCMVR